MWMRSEYDLTELPEPFERRVLLEDVLVPGGVAGVLGGAVTLLAAVITSGLLRYGYGTPLKLLAGIFWRDSNLAQLDGWPMVIAALVQLGGAAGLGLTFALMLPRGGTGVGAIGLASLTALGVYVVSTQFLLDFGDPLMARSVPVMAYFPFALLMGGFLPLVVPIRRALAAWVHVRHRVDEALHPVHPETE